MVLTMSYIKRVLFIFMLTKIEKDQLLCCIIVKHAFGDSIYSAA